MTEKPGDKPVPITDVADRLRALAVRVCTLGGPHVTAESVVSGKIAIATALWDLADALEGRGASSGPS